MFQDILETPSGMVFATRSDITISSGCNGRLSVFLLLLLEETYAQLAYTCSVAFVNTIFPLFVHGSSITSKHVLLIQKMPLVRRAFVCARHKLFSLLCFSQC